MDNKGFTLVELMVVVVIIGILVAIIIPIYGKVQDRAAIKTHEANLRTVDEAIALYIAQFGHEPQAYGDSSMGAGVRVIDELVDKGFLSERPEVPRRLLENVEWFTSPYDGFLISFQEAFSIDTLYYEIYEDVYGNQKTFPTLVSGDYRVGEKPKNDIQVELVRTYIANR